MFISATWKYKLERMPGFISIYAAVCSFCVYCCMYAFRKPFTAAGFSGLHFLKIDYKVWLVFAQLVGYMLSKFYGIRFIAGMQPGKRANTIVVLIVFAWLALLLFAITPSPYNIIFLLLNGFPLGMIWGLVFSYLEGRRTTEFMGAVLSVSFIFSSGFVKSIGKSLVVNHHVSEFWMPFYTGSFFLIPLLVFTWLLNHMPPPTDKDIQLRNVRKPMTKQERKNFIALFLPGIVIIVTTYVLLTILRDFRDNFSNELYTELGYGNDPSIFTKTETPVSLIVLISMSLLILVKNNIKAFLLNHFIIIAGYMLALFATLLFINKTISPVWWMILIGTGLYISYVPFNALYFERMIATYKVQSNVGFIMYVSDAFGYLGSVLILFLKEFTGMHVSWTDFFTHAVLLITCMGIAGTLAAAIYFRQKHKSLFGLSLNIQQHMPRKTAIVIGAGIVGLAVTRSLALRDYKVTVFERNAKAVGASVRNFGMIWPVGQPNGVLYERALRSKSIWKEVCNEAGLWYEDKGSLHVAYNDYEVDVINEVASANKNIRPLEIVNADDAYKLSQAINTKNLKAALYSKDEMIVEARVAIEKIPAYLHEKFNVEFLFNTAISFIDYPHASSGEQSWQADEIYVCGGADFETLYPEIFAANNFTKCKLQMMRLVAQDNNFRIGTSLCGGLSLIHYKAFEVAPSLSKLRNFYKETMPDYIKWGIHVMVSQNETGELTIGDSHEYGLVFDPFDKQFINQLITDYLKQFASFKNWQLLQSWHGIYPKKTDNTTEFIHQPQQGVTIVNGIGGAGMTLSFGLAEEVMSNL